MIPDKIFTEAAQWSCGRNWLIRLPFLLYFTYVLFRYLFSPGYACIIQPLNLGIHECGHMIFSFFGQFLMVLGGTLTELMTPCAGVWNFYLQRDYFACVLCFGWLSTALFDVARYSADAMAMELPLVSPFGTETVKHDWNYLLTTLGILPHDYVVGGFFWLLAIAAMLFSLVVGGWLLSIMFFNPAAGDPV